MSKIFNINNLKVLDIPNINQEDIDIFTSFFDTLSLEKEIVVDYCCETSEILKVDSTYPGFIGALDNIIYRIKRMINYNGDDFFVEIEFEKRAKNDPYNVTNLYYKSNNEQHIFTINSEDLKNKLNMKLNSILNGKDMLSVAEKYGAALIAYNTVKSCVESHNWECLLNIMKNVVVLNDDLIITSKTYNGDDQVTCEGKTLLLLIIEYVISNEKNITLEELDQIKKIVNILKDSKLLRVWFYDCYYYHESNIEPVSAKGSLTHTSLCYSLENGSYDIQGNVLKKLLKEE